MAKELTRKRMECGDLSPLWLSWNAKRRQVAALHTLRDPKCLIQFNFNLRRPHPIHERIASKRSGASAENP
jgi:hypothetical protein